LLLIPVKTLKRRNRAMAVAARAYLKVMLMLMQNVTRDM
jgi:hypothetical protein